MTIDERLEKLTERHEAMAVTMENLQGMMHGLNARQEKTDAQIGRLETQMSQQAAENRRFTRALRPALQAYLEDENPSEG